MSAEAKEGKAEGGGGVKEEGREGSSSAGRARAAREARGGREEIGMEDEDGTGTAAGETGGDERVAERGIRDGEDDAGEIVAEGG